MDSIYKIAAEPQLLKEELEIRFPDRRFFLLTDRKVARHCLPLIKPYLPSGTTIFQIPDGEQHKNLATCETVWEFLLKHKADRESVLLILGGGVVSDLGAFCASVYKRGIDFVLIPTTLLAMVDASIGGKTAVDFQSGKNLIGTFKIPRLIWTFPDFLKTLPQIGFLSGFAEVIKHTLISDAVGWNQIRKGDPELMDWLSLLEASQKIKQAIVDQDPFETGIRQKLNAGHTVGHAIESLFLSRGKSIPHGYAVAAGLIMESYLSFIEGLMDAGELGQVEEFLFATYGGAKLSPDDCLPLWNWMLQDKKNKKGTVRMALIGPLGSCRDGQPISKKKWERAFSYYLGI
ncbi:MAG TPA: 3-dehydroquinate synthase family protein [Catalimonadaceae bacterium]|nr:3-dehydroquinate synthase family protein [Catalimonadaceae bacterium]